MLKLSASFAALAVLLPFVAGQSAEWGQCEYYVLFAYIVWNVVDIFCVLQAEALAGLVLQPVLRALPVSRRTPTILNVSLA